jgi:hypothetical protein
MGEKMMKMLGWGVLALALLVAGYTVVGRTILNPRVLRELREHPQGARAAKVMALSLPSGKTIPVNYWQDAETVYAAADFPWWRELRGEEHPVRVLIRGESRMGRGRAVEDDPVLREKVFARLRPSAPAWTGTLVEIVLEER